MIRELYINNFQSHKKSHLVFADGLNVIVGKTDSGKTGIIRALRLVAENLPAGESYRSNWGGDTSVITVFDNCTVERGRTNSSNYYKLEKTEYTAFGRAVPDEIKQAINFDSTSIQQQLDSPFLLSETPGAVASHFNDVGGLSIIDRAESSIKKSINETNASIGFLSQTIGEEIVVCDSYSYLKDMECAISEIEGQVSLYNEMQGVMKELITEIENTEKIRLKIRSFSKITTCEDIDVLLEAYSSKKIKQKFLEDFSSAQSECDQTGQRVIYLSANCDTQLIDKILSSKDSSKELKNRTHILNEVVASIEDVALQLQQNQQTPQECTLLDAVLLAKSKRQGLFLQGNTIQALYISLRRLTKDIQAQEVLTRQLETTYEKEFPNICPLCNSDKHGKN